MPDRSQQVNVLCVKDIEFAMGTFASGIIAMDISISIGMAISSER